MILKSLRADLRRLLFKAVVVTLAIPLFVLAVNIGLAIGGTDVHWMIYIIGAQGWIIVCLVSLVIGMISASIRGAQKGDTP